MRKRRQVAADRAEALESALGTIETIDQTAPPALIDLGSALSYAVAKMPVPELLSSIAERTGIKRSVLEQALYAESVLAPHRPNLESMCVSTEVVAALAEGEEQDVDRGVQALQSYGGISLADLQILMNSPDELHVYQAPHHALLRFDMASMEALAAMKTHNGFRIFREMVSRIIQLIDRLEEVGFNHEESETIRMQLRIGGNHLVTMIGNLILLPHPVVGSHSFIYPAWPPQASPWNRLLDLSESSLPDLFRVRAMMQQLLGSEVA
jgi:DNA-binding transcriptional MerR regulator